MLSPPPAAAAAATRSTGAASPPPAPRSVAASHTDTSSPQPSPLASPAQRMPRWWVTPAAILVPIVAVVTLLCYQAAIDASSSIINSHNSELKARCMRELQDVAGALMDERDAAALSVALLQAPALPLTLAAQGMAAIAATRAGTTAALDRLLASLRALTADAAGFVASRRDVNALTQFLTGVQGSVADLRRGHDSALAAAAAASVMGAQAITALGASLTPYATLYAPWSAVISSLVEVDQVVLRLGIEVRLTQGTAGITADLASFSSVARQRAYFAQLRGLCTMALASGRFENVSMAQAYLLAWGNSVEAVSRFRLATDPLFASAEIPVLPREGEPAFTIAATVASLWMDITQYASGHGTVYGVAADGTANVSDRYIDGSQVLYGAASLTRSLFPGVAPTPVSLALAFYNLTTTLSTAFTGPVYTRVNAAVADELRRLRAGAETGVAIGSGVGVAVLLIACVVVYLLLRQRRAEAAALAEKMSAESAEALSSLIAHELRNPIWALTTNIEAVQEVLEAAPHSVPAEVREMVHDMESSSQSLLRLVCDVLDLSRLRAGKLEIISEPTDIAAVVRDTARQFRGMAAASGIDLLVVIAMDVPASLVIDGPRLRQLLSNGITNAIKGVRRRLEARRIASDSAVAAAVPARIMVRLSLLPIPALKYSRRLLSQYRTGASSADLHAIAWDPLADEHEAAAAASGARVGAWCGARSATRAVAPAPAPMQSGPTPAAARYGEGEAAGSVGSIASQHLSLRLLAQTPPAALPSLSPVAQPGVAGAARSPTPPGGWTPAGTDAAPSSMTTVSVRSPRVVAPLTYAFGLVVEVADTGIGLGAGDPERFFRPYNSTFGAGSTGLGLAITRQLAARMGGGVWLRNADPDDAVFAPAASAASPASTARAHSPRHGMADVSPSRTPPTALPRGGTVPPSERTRFAPSLASFPPGYASASAATRSRRQCPRALMHF